MAELKKNLAGAWVNNDSGTHFYGSMGSSDLIVPYCYEGDDKLTGAYFGWQRTGDYWFARFAWCRRGPAGFTFLRQTAVDVLRGAWWSDKQDPSPKAPLKKGGFLPRGNASGAPNLHLGRFGSLRM
jgi:hypothetical protein